jgi:hypothetical protein
MRFDGRVSLVIDNPASGSSWAKQGKNQGS